MSAEQLAVIPTGWTPRAVDVDNLIDAIRAALLASPAVTNIVGDRIGPTAMPSGTDFPYVVLNRPSVVYASQYADPMVNALIDISAFDRDEATDGWATRRVRTLITACVAAVIDQRGFPIAGMTLMSCDMESDGTGFLNVDAVADGVMTRGRVATVRLRALVNHP